MMQKKTQIVITILLSIIELFLFFLLRQVYPISMHSSTITIISYALPSGIIFFLNYYIVSHIIYYLILLIWQLSGHYNRISNRFSIVAKKCAAWLIDMPTHWGEMDSTIYRQNANTCEGLLALQKAGMINRYSSIYNETLDYLIMETSNIGLASKSLNCETVVCTSMVLYLYSQNRKLNGLLYDYNWKFNKIAQYLWDVRSPIGWGVYVSRTAEENCSFANTFWALYALKEYNDLVKTNEYTQFVRQLYEYSNNSTFGFSRGDTARLWPTAMSVILYYNFSEELRNSLSQVYNVKSAAKYVFKKFCNEKVEYETETLTGINKNTLGATKAPWRHITIGVVLEALVLAYNNRDLSLIDMNLLVLRLKKLCRTNINSCGVDKCYYVPREMELRHNNIFTFPTAYLIWGLNEFNHIRRRRLL